MKPELTSREILGTGKFLSLELLHYRDAKGAERTWEAVRRQNTPNAVIIIARTVPEDCILLVRQFRPALGRYSVAFPAGLIDPGETAATAALRELKEETGYSGKLLHVGPYTSSSAGLSAELLASANVQVDLNAPENKLPQTDFQDGEDIQTFVVPMSDLQAFLQKHLDDGDGLDSRLAFWALALGNVLG
ncbi:MAG: NUDIX domain-containing protein [Victivallales bacterium]|jgi:8-oxo-dGTP pyrophosphatase MutT (NUDIX family)|nr:NUDIX domain-containing protein [Victivallales bacterium]